jgi:hypothetical protein
VSAYIEWGALGAIVVFGVLIGAGLPALFALGVRALEGPGARDADGRRSALRTTAGYACFAVALSTIAAAIVFIAAGGH